MGLFDNVKRTYARVKVLNEVTALAKGGSSWDSFKPLYAYLQVDENLSAVLTHFKATRDELFMCYSMQRTLSEDAMRTGHLVAAEALLNLDTLSYLIRAERRQVPQIEAHEAVLHFIQSKGLVFQPERTLRAREGI